MNLSEEGCSFQSLAPVRGEQVRFSVSVGDGHKLEGDGQLVWSDSGKKTGGVRFLNPSQELREQVRAWLDQTLVTTDGKLDPAAVESEAKRRRKKLREEGKAEAERAKREGTPKRNEIEIASKENLPVAQLKPANNSNTSASANSIAPGDSGTRTTFGKSAITLRGIGTIALAAMLFAGLVGYRRDLGHLVMSVGSHIAGDKGAPEAPAEAGPRVNASSEVRAVEVKAVVLSDATHEAAKESSSDTAGTGKVELLRAADVPTAPAKHTPAVTQQERETEGVSSLWTSVENGDTVAEVILASRYVRGEGVPQSCAQARVLLEAAIKRGSSDAQQKLGELGQAGCP